MRLFPAIVCILSFLVFEATGQIIHVPADYPTIQEGVNAAIDGDTVLVAPGTYFENISLNGTNITLASHFLVTNDTSYISSTVINGGQVGTVITINQGEDSTTRISGFSITNGLGENEYEGGGFTVSWTYPSLDHLRIYGNTADNGGGITISYCDPVISDCFIQDNIATYSGGGIYCESSSPIMDAVRITGNLAYDKGGGISLGQSHPITNNVTISDNAAGNSGGGMIVYNASPKLVLKQVIVSGNQAADGAGIDNDSYLELNNCEITDNSCYGNGGGVYSRNSLWLVNTKVSDNAASSGGGLYIKAFSFARLDTVDLTENKAIHYGGGIFCEQDSYTQLYQVNLSDNNSEMNGGGIFCDWYSELDLHGSTISSNHALYSGGGIYWGYYTSTPHFDTTDRCNIYLNGAGTGNDLYSNHDTINIVVDTFTVIHPTDYHAEVKTKFNFDILHGKIEQPDADLYVSLEGDDSNSGLTPEVPLKTIDRAFQKLRSDINHQHTVHLANGVYSPSTNGEKFPVQMVNHSSLAGESRSLTILDAEQTNQVLNLDYDSIPDIRNLTISGGEFYDGAGIGCLISESTFNNIKVAGNTAIGLGSGFESEGGGIQITMSGKIKLYNMIIENNKSDFGGGIFASYSNLEMFNVEVVNNHATTGGGIYLINYDTVTIDNMRLSSNVATELGGGIYARLSRDLTILNSVIGSNSSRRGGGMWTENTSPVVKNSLISNNSASQYCGGAGLYYDYYAPIDHESEFFNVTFSDNTFPGLYCLSAGVGLVNSIFWDNAAPYQIQYSEPGTDDTLLVMNTDIQGGFDGIYITGSPIINWLPGNIDENPQFLLSGDYPYSLEEGSPCIDAGTPDTTGLYLPFNDMIGNTRVWDGDGDGVPIIDMGPYEFGAPVHIPDEGSLNDLSSGDTYIFPNPASDHLTIGSSNNQTDRTVTFINSVGQVVYSSVIPAGQEKLVISLDDFSQGLYTLIFTNEKGVYAMGKLVVIN